MARSKVLVPLFCRSYFGSRWCVQEFALMVKREEMTGFNSDTNSQRLIIPALIHDGEHLPDNAKKIQSCDLREYANPRTVPRGPTEEALSQLNDTITMEPTHWQPHYHLANIYLDINRPDDATSAAEKAVELSGGASIALMILASVRFVTGRADEGQELLGRLLERAQTVYVPPVFFAWIAMARNDPDGAYQYVEKAIDMKDAWLNFNNICPRQLRAEGGKIDALLEKSGWR